MGNVRMRAEQINYGASNVKVALDDLDPKDLIALSARMDTIEAWKATVKTEEKTGASVEYTNALALAAVSLSTEIEASQDLHGYDHPWVGGAGKNKVDASAVIQGTFDDPTSTSNCLSDYIPVTANTAYYMSGNSGYADGIYIRFYDASKVELDTSTRVTKYVVDFGFTVPSDAIYARIMWYKSGGLTPTNIVNALVQLEIGSSKTAFAPYSNICPISGRTSVTITDYDSESNTATVTIQLGQTVYGGTLNVTTGVLTIDSGFDTKAVASVYANASNPNCDFAVMQPTTDFFSITASTLNKFISNKARAMQGSETFNNISQIGVMLSYSSANKQIAISAPKGATLAEMQSLFGDVQICYPLATPQTIQLTPTQLTMLKGYNRLSSDGGGDITVEAYTGAAWGGDEA